MTFPEVVTEAEILSYEQREAASPEAGEFVGGHGEFFFVVLLVGVFVLLYLYLKKEGEI
jgi:hypothetical protein